MGTHESQSLFWERHIGLSRPFWRFAHPHLTQILDQSFFQQYTPEDVYKAVNRVSRSLIRVEADELTYPLHVILRYNIEKDVIAGKLHVKDIATRWNQDMKLLLNIDVPTDDKGALQDVHWSGLAFGYFPTYLIGAIAAAQLYHYCAMDIPDIERKIESGDFVPIKDWLKEKVHRHGRRYPSLDAMLEEQLGEALNPKYFIDYLTTKYSELYQILVTITVQRKLTILRPKARSIHKGQPSTIKYLEDAVVGHAIEMRQLREAIDRAKEWLLETRPILSAPNVFKEYTINMDQAPLPFSLASSTTLELEGEKTVTIRQTENSKTRCTVSLTITADGRKLKPMIIFKSQRGAGRLRPENLQPASIETTWCSAVNTMPGKTRKT
ncbi:peptidase M32 carboxypeptidase Taq metallopeptidase family protein [Nitzschia inconspicua]|nr:peptidase M32 carboxypeptidase Taq metallopeptidase family protein [Nitzschia inconspicua]